MVRRRVRERCGEVARLAIEALQRKLDAAGGPEDARAVQQIRREAEGLVREYLDVTGRSELYDLVARRRS